jgi:Tol biopolymer transport system component
MPFVGRPVKIDVALPTMIVYGGDGRSIYGRFNINGIWRIDLLTRDRVLIPGTEVFAPNHSMKFAVSPETDRLAVFGDRIERDGGCALYVFEISSGNRKALREEKPCRTFLSDLGFPHGRKQVFAVATRDAGAPQPVLFDLTSGAMESIGHGHLEDFHKFSWAPDGKSVAAEEIFRSGSTKSAKLVLLDPLNFQVQRTLGSLPDSRFSWSPDSKFLLVLRPQLSCMYGGWSFYAIDASSGKRDAIHSSRCKIDGGADGWVTKDVYQAALSAQSK